MAQVAPTRAFQVHARGGDRTNTQHQCKYTTNVCFSCKSSGHVRQDCTKSDKSALKRGFRDHANTSQTREKKPRAVLQAWLPKTHPEARGNPRGGKSFHGEGVKEFVKEKKVTANLAGGEQIRASESESDNDNENGSIQKFVSDSGATEHLSNS